MRILQSPLLRSANAAVLVSALLLSPVYAQQLPSVPSADEIREMANRRIEEAMHSQEIPGRFIVMLKDRTTADPAALAAEYGMKNAQAYTMLRGFAGALNASQVSALKSDPRVAVVEPDVLVHTFAQTLPTGINRAEAELAPTAMINGKDERVNVDVAVIDTGVQLKHPDLNVFKSANFSTEFYFPDDMNGHGTHVAGTIGAKDNTVGVVGMAPGARIWAVKVLDRNGSGPLSNVIKGIDYVTANASQIEVANLSLGCQCTSVAMNTAISRSVAAGVVYVVAAGNSAMDAATFSPANHPDVITVSAIADFNGLPGGGAPKTCRNDVDETFADFSNFGSVVDIAAPGVCILSTWKGSGYNTISGTSMASPHVAGAAALYVAKNGKPTNAAGVVNVKDALIAAAFVQNALNGFNGDPDEFTEPLLNVTGF